ncbi:CLUMA_CG001689, isoform A [Clunio marinus]|uniref:CLUMA_CG001689, isoform A n=1 Tax=Clunio marinus TaxID=568069 RepID=A0A1J1HN59_9DIPT|nr:CLUMA_CG001689, isoform A [Clunio marinus]
MSATATKNSITLKGSAAIIKEYLNYGVNSILFQRGIYPAENFTPVQQYGLTILMSKDEKIKEFLSNVLTQAEEWLATNKVEKFSMTISNVQTREVLECWDFKVESELMDQNQDPNKIDPNNPVSSKELKKIQTEIGAVMRQIAATVSYLPLIESVCSFDLLIHTLKDTNIPENWDETDKNALAIKNSQVVHLKSFSTGLQKVETVVSYKMVED